MSNALAVAVAAALVATVAAGCGNQAFRINAEVARAMLEVQTVSGPAIRQARINASVSAAATVQSSGGSMQAAQSAADAEATRWQCAIDGHGIYSVAVGAYIDALSTWSADLAGFDVGVVFDYVASVLETYSFLSSCLTALGNDTLPVVAAFIGMIPTTWGVTEDGQ